MLLFLAAWPAFGADLTFPFINSGGYSTTFVLVNPGDAPIAVPNFWQPFGAGGQPPTIAARSASRFEAFPRAGIGVFTMDVPDGLRPYVEITTRLQTMTRVGPLAPAATSFDFYDLRQTDDLESYVFVSAPHYGPLDLASVDGQFVWLAEGDGTSITRASSAHAVVVSPVPVYSFGFVVHTLTGAITAVPPN
jgi:hypothetical protein